MSTTAIGSSSGTSSTAASGTSTTASSGFNLSSSDFIQMMITQLQQQDPTDPVKNSDLLAQMSQIGQLQTSTTLNSTLNTMTLQNSVGSASSLIGKTVQGTDANSADITGTVTSVSVAGSTVNLNLDSGSVMPLANVSSIANATTTTASTGTGTASATTGA